MQQTGITNKNTLHGIVWMLICGILFVLVTGTVRYLGSSMPAMEAAFIRYAFGIVIMAPVLFRVLRKPISAGLWGGFALRGVCHGIGVILWFYAMARIPIAEVTAIGYVTPIFVTIGAALFLGEIMHFRRIAGVVVGLLGAVIILRPGFQEISIGQLAQLGTAPLFAASFLMTKMFTDKSDSETIVAMLTLFCTLTLLPGAIWQWRTPTPHELALLALTAVFATAGHFAMTKALALAPISATQPVTFLQLVWATALGIVVFNEPADIFVILGGALIVAAASYISYRESVAARGEVTPPANATKV